MSEKEARKILGIEDVELDDKKLNKQYHDMAKKIHPDLNPNDEDAKVKFQLLNEANEILKRLLENPQINYNLYVNQKINDLEKKYINNIFNRKDNLEIAKFIRKKIDRLKEFSKEYKDISLFDDDYNMILSSITNALVKFKNYKLDALEASCVQDLETKKKFEEFRNSILDITNVYEIEDKCHTFKKSLQNNKINVVNDIFLETKKKYLYKTYIGNGEFNDEEFIKQRNEIKKIIDDIFNNTKQNTSVVEFDMYYLVNNRKIENMVENYKNKIFNTIADISILKEYPYTVVEVFSKMNRIKTHNISKIYNIYIEIKETLKEIIITSICDRLDNIIEKNKNINNFSQVEENVRKKYSEIVSSINIDITKPIDFNYELKLSEEIHNLVSDYSRLNQERNKIINELRQNRINNNIIDNLSNAYTYNELNDAIMAANNYLNDIKKARELANKRLEKQRKITSIKIALRNRPMLRGVYEKSKIEDMVKQIENVLNKYKENEIDNIDMLLEINFKDYEHDLNIINSVFNQNKKIENNNYKDYISNQKDDFEEIESIFKHKEIEQRREYVDKMNQFISKKYEKVKSNLLVYEKMEIFYQVREIFNQYLNFKVNDISKLVNINFKDYDMDMQIINDITNINHKHNR